MKRALGVVVLVLSLAAGTARAQSFSNPALAGPTVLPRAVQQVDLEEHLGRALDRAIVLTDMDGRRVHLGDELPGDAPVVLVLAYYRCPMLCGLVLRGVVTGMQKLSFQLGRQFRALTVSFDPRDTPEAARKKRASTLAGLGQGVTASPQWPFLVGDEPAIRALAGAVGFRYAYDSRTDQFAHPAAAIVLTPDGRISRYLYGVDFSPRDLRLALTEAGEGKVGTIVDRLLLTCYHYDPAARAYAPFIIGFMRIGGVIILVTVAGLCSALFLGERRRRRALPPGSTVGLRPAKPGSAPHPGGAP
jgi:protein SCO1